MDHDPFEQDNSSRLRQRLWGAAVLIAIAVIVLPVILDGAGSESQFRRVEQLREAPQFNTNADAGLNDEEARVIRIVSQTRALGDNATPESTVLAPEPSSEPAPATAAALPELETPSLTAWVVQAAAFTHESDAVQIRDQLRRAGFASFVRDREASTDPFRVLVGPMIKQRSAEKARRQVANLLQNEPVILEYP